MKTGWLLIFYCKIAINSNYHSKHVNPSPDRYLSLRTKWSHLPTDACHGERSEPISLPDWRLLQSQRTLLRNDSWRASLQNSVRIVSWVVIQRSHLPTDTCHGERSEAISRPDWRLLQSQRTLLRNDSWRAFLQNAVRMMSWVVIQQSHLPIDTCHGERSEAISRPD